MKKSAAARSPSKKVDDSIADDVRKIKESMKPKAASVKKAAAKSTPGRPRGAAKKEIVKEPVKLVEVEKPKAPVNELKNELLADWLDDDDADMEKVEGKISTSS